MLCVWKSLGKFEALTKMSHSYGKAWVDLQAGLGRLSGNHQGGANNVSQVEWLEIQIWCPPVNSGGAFLEKEQWPLPALLSGRNMLLWLSL